MDKSVKDTLNLHPRIMKALQRCGMHKLSSVLIYSNSDLTRMLGISPQDVNLLVLAASNAALPATPLVSTALALYRRQAGLYNWGRLSWGCPVLDSRLGGGVLVPGVTELSGVSGAGKTQLCMQLCLVAQLMRDQGGLSGGAVYISTEDVFPSKRLCQLAEQFTSRTHHSSSKHFTDNVFIEHVGSVSALSVLLEYKLPSLMDQHDIKLIIIDSVAALFRADYVPSQHSSRAKLLRTIGAKLVSLSWKYSAAVVCVNQVSSIIHHEDADPPFLSTVRPSLGLSWADIANMRIMLYRDEYVDDIQTKSSLRYLLVLSAPHLTNIKLNYNIGVEGVYGIEEHSPAPS